MLDLPIHEMAIFALAIAAYLAAAVVGVLQLLAGGQRYRRLISPLVLAAVVLEAALLISRAIEIKAVPLTGIFESMIVLTMACALLQLFVGRAIRRVWFGSVMVWVIFGLVVLTAAVAEPASQAHEAASTPWAIAHAIAMILGGAAAMLAAASAGLYLFGRRKLKQKRVLQVLGKVPNIETLERMNLFGLKWCFYLMTLGLGSGIGMAATTPSVDMTGRDWLTDPKIVLVAAVWLLLAMILALLRTVKLKEKTVAYATIVAFALILFAVVGTLAFCGSGHDF
ncbi:MAG: cytochrome c biogenesis protein CcsA [Phycisphaerae bacterium]|nr:cytochrome c biogenesis protein CcsA [Phycisphaerae bacterium]